MLVDLCMFTKIHGLSPGAAPPLAMFVGESSAEMGPKHRRNHWDGIDVLVYWWNSRAAKACTYRMWKKSK